MYLHSHLKEKNTIKGRSLDMDTCVQTNRGVGALMTYAEDAN